MTTLVILVLGILAYRTASRILQVLEMRQAAKLADAYQLGLRQATHPGPAPDSIVIHETTLN